MQRKTCIKDSQVQTFEQRSPEWFSARLGKVTASRVADVIAKTKNGYSTSRENYAVELALERITGNRQESFTNAAMQWGTDQEPFARAAYEAAYGILVEEVGLVPHPTIAMAAASPDGLVGTNGLIEVKAPNSATHLKTLLSGKADSRYIPQMQWQLACTGREWCDFVSFNPRFPEHLQLAIYRVNTDAQKIKELENEVSQFLTEVDLIVEKLNGITVPSNS
jgi:putative phage-type endonuclease